MNVLFVPSIGLDISLLERLAASVDYHMPYKIVLNNGPLGALEDFSRRHPDWIIKDSAYGNVGVAGAWNEAAKLFPDESILILNDDCYFLPGYLERICRAADIDVQQGGRAPVVHLNDSNAYYAFVWTKSGREDFGLFDENFFFYYEDCDMRVRHRLGGVTSYPCALQGAPPMPHGKPQSGGMNYNALIQGVGLYNRAYWLRKWGSLNFEKAHYQTPYKDHRLTYKDVIWYPEERAKRWPLWDTFMSLPDPSIYT